MPTKTTAQSGNWSNPATWVGGAIPADGDAVVIAEGHTLTLDKDLAADYGFSIGVAGLTISGSSAAPGRLTCPTASGRYVLLVKAGCQIVGTSAVNKGQLYAGSAETPLPNGAYFGLQSLTADGTTFIDASNLDLRLYCTHPANRWAKLTAQTAAGSNSFAVDRNVTADAPWSTAAGRNVAALVNVNKNQDYQRTTLASINPATLTTADNADSLQVAGAYLVLLSRNIEILYGGTGTAIALGTNNAVLHAALRQTSATQRGTGLTGSAVAGNTILQGTINGFTSGIYTTFHCRFDGAVVGCVNGIYGLAATNVSVPAGSLVGGCSTGIRGDGGGAVAGTVAGCVNGLVDAPGVCISGTVEGCYSGAAMAYVQGQGATFQNNSQDFYACPSSRLFATALKSAVQVAQYQTPNYGAFALLAAYDVRDAQGAVQPGRMRWWTPGGFGVSLDWASVPAQVQTGIPVSADYLHEHVFESAEYANFVDVPLWGEANVPLLVRVWLRKQQSGMAAAPSVELIDPNLAFGNPAAALASATMADHTDWQTLILAFTPAHDRQLILRVSGRNAAGTLYWNFDVLFGWKSSGVVGRTAAGMVMASGALAGLIDSPGPAAGQTSGPGPLIGEIHG